MTTDTQTIAVYDARAQEYADKFTSLKAGRHLRAFMAELPPQAHVLDLGCGPGNSAAILAQAGHRAEAWDASAEMVKLAASHPGVAARQAVFDDLGAEGVFDGIWANFALLHAPRERMDDHLAAIARALKPGGVFHIGMKTGDDAARDGLGRQYTFYTRDDLHARLMAAGLTPFAEEHGQDEGLAGNVEPWIVILARKDG